MAEVKTGVVQMRTYRLSQGKISYYIQYQNPTEDDYRTIEVEPKQYNLIVDEKLYNKVVEFTIEQGNAHILNERNGIDEQIVTLIHRIDKIGRDYDVYEYGLPVENLTVMTELKNLIKEFLNKNK